MNKVKIICINGHSRSGKDSFVDFISKLSHNHDFSVSEISTVGSTYEALRCCNLIDSDKKGEEERIFLAAVKKAYIKYSNGPFNEVVDYWEYLTSKKSIIKNILLFVHVREQDEIKKLADYFSKDFISIWIDRNEAIFQEGDSRRTEWNYDYIIDNNGTTKDLEEGAHKFLEDIERS